MLSTICLILSLLCALAGVVLMVSPGGFMRAAKVMNKEYSVEIEAEGEIEPLTTFLHQLNTSDQLLRVEKLRLNFKKKGDTTLKASMLITRVLVL